jgi:hypothetical protein
MPKSNVQTDLPTTGLLQATQMDGVPMIIAGRSRDWGGENGIMIWKKRSATTGRVGLIIFCLNIIALAVAVVLVYPNVLLKVGA